MKQHYLRTALSLALCTAAFAQVKTRDQLCSDAAQIVGVQYDSGWHTFHNVSAEKAGPLAETLQLLGVFAPQPQIETPEARWSKKLGPTFLELNPTAVDTRPTLYRPRSTMTNQSFANKISPWEVGPTVGPSPDDDYWSCAGQVAYVPDASIPNNSGLDRIQTFAYYNHVFATSPRLDGGSWRQIPDPNVDDYRYMSVPRLIQPVAVVRNYAMLSNEALVVYANGFLGIAGTQTSRDGGDWPLKGLQLPANKVPTAISLTSSNEFALITVTDTTTSRGQIAVIALEGKYLPFHTWPYMGLANQGSWSDFKLLGFIDLPFNKPDAIASASNGFWNGPSQTGNQMLSQINLGNANTRWGVRQGEYGWTAIIATGGYAVVSSKTEGKVAFVNLAPLFNYVRNSYLNDATYASTISGRTAGTWPTTFDADASIKPTIAFQTTLDKPTCVLAGLQIDRWSPDRFKAYVATESGRVVIFDTSSLMARWDWELRGTLGSMGEFTVGRNPTAMCFARFNPGSLPLIPAGRSPDPLNNVIHVCCRGDRRIDSVVTLGGSGRIYQTIADSRMDDPVHVSVADRGNILTVADYNGKKIHSFRLGSLYARSPYWGQVGERFGCGATGNDAFEYAGSLSIAGNPFYTGSSNVN